MSLLFLFDKVGNRTYSTIDGVQTAYTYDDNDRLTQAGGIAYTYDANGNTLTETEDGDITTYTYDARNRLVSREDASVLARYGYDIHGIRSSKTENGVTTNYVVDHNRPYAQVLAESSNGATSKEYTYGDDLLSQQAANDSHFYLYDGLGSTRALTDSGGSVTDRYDYEAFGELLNRVGETDNSYLYTGEQYDPNLGQYYLRARYYNQGVGRFTQMDTWGGINNQPVTLNKYLYAHADPVLNTDPSGRFIAGLSATQSIAVTLAATSVTAYSIGQSLAGNSWDIDEGYSSNQLGWLVIAGMINNSSWLYDTLKSKAREKDDSDNTFTLYRAVEDIELASLYSCNCFALGPSQWPKQFFNSPEEAHQFGEYMLGLGGSLAVDRYHLVEATISGRMRAMLRDSHEPGVGPIVEVPNGLLPAFNADMDFYGGWSYISSHE